MNYYVENTESTYKDEIEKIIKGKSKEIFDFFNEEERELNFDIYIYKDIKSLKEGLEKRGYTKLPSYICACYKDEDNSLNFFEPKENPNNDDWTKEEYKIVIFHELIHGIQNLLFGITPEWLNDGIAKYLDKTYSKGIKWLIENHINKRDIPNQNEIEEEFGYHDYDSYDYVYLMVSYLIESLGKDKFIELLKDSNKLNKEKNNLLNKAIYYYKEKYNIK